LSAYSRDAILAAHVTVVHAADGRKGLSFGDTNPSDALEVSRVGDKEVELATLSRRLAMST